MKKNTELLNTETFYHVYNRGTNGETIFKSETNYKTFLEKYAFHLEPVVATYAYCLMPNHFHFLIRTKSESDIIANAKIQYPDKEIQSISHYISNQFAHLFNGYTQVINKTFQRTGGLFETPFRRIEVKEDAYFSQLIWYIHQNPQKHGFVNDFRNYPYSSYHSHLASKPTKLQRAEVLEWFGNESEYVKYHHIQNDHHQLKDLIIEFD